MRFHIRGPQIGKVIEVIFVYLRVTTVEPPLSEHLCPKRVQISAEIV